MPFWYSLLTGEKECIFPKEAPCCGIDYTPVGRTYYGTASPLIKRVGDTFYFMSVWHGAAHIYALSIIDNKVSAITTGKIAIQDFSAPKNGKIIYIRGDYTTIAELFVLIRSLARKSGLPILTDGLMTSSFQYRRKCGLTQRTEKSAYKAG